MRSVVLETKLGYQTIRSPLVSGWTLAGGPEPSHNPVAQHMSAPYYLRLLLHQTFLVLKYLRCCYVLHNCFKFPHFMCKEFPNTEIRQMQGCCHLIVMYTQESRYSLDLSLAFVIDESISLYGYSYLWNNEPMFSWTVPLQWYTYIHIIHTNIYPYSRYILWQVLCERAPGRENIFILYIHLISTNELAPVSI